VPIKVERVELSSGARQLFTMLEPASAAVSGITNLIVTPQGAITYAYVRSRSALYVISGIR
jgi:hypothetical protein